MNSNIKYKTLDLFAGVGGIRLGFELTGKFETVFSNDFDKNCKLTYDLNFPESKLFVEDLKNIVPENLPDFDFLLGGFPCQPFSIAGYRQGFDDSKGRGDLFFFIAKIIEVKQPKGFLLENVKNLHSHDNGRTLKIILETLSDLGYSTKYKILNGLTHGNLPQNRERVFLVGFKNKVHFENFEFPDEIPLSSSFKEYLEEFVSGKYYYNDKPLFSKISNEIVDSNSIYQWRRKYVRQNKKNVCPTLTANMGMGGHNVPLIIDYRGIRKLTPKECFNLQGFPRDYKLPHVADSILYKQAGNSVNVPVIKRIAESILKILEI
jgi:DNA (cytosine-5)-methyltransferase 1